MTWDPSTARSSSCNSPGPAIISAGISGRLRGSTSVTPHLLVRASVLNPCYPPAREALLGCAAMRPADVARLLLLAAIWGSSFLLIKVALEDLGPLHIVAGRLVLGAAFLV